MNRKKQFIFFLIFLASLFFLFGPEFLPENFQFRELLNSAAGSDVVIIFNSGGWGNTPPEEAEDFTPIIKEIQKVLADWGYTSTVVPYERTKDSFLGKITGIKEFLNSFQSQSKNLAQEIEHFSDNNPETKIVVAGLSDGGRFVDETIEKLSKEAQRIVYAIELGVPFWQKNMTSENILRLDNNGQDPLARGKIKILLSYLIRAPAKWLLARASGNSLTFSQATHVPAHEYYWDVVGPEITFFLKNKINPL